MLSSKFNRRTFLKLSSLAGSGLLVGCTFSSPKILSSPKAINEELGLWVRISADNKVTLILPASEMGQHAHTGQAMLLAEELEADWKTINVVTAPFHPEFINSQADPRGVQVTGGSSSISFFWEKIRLVGASSREMLKIAASQKWGVPLSECTAQDGRVFHKKNNLVANYGELVSSAAKIQPPNNPILKSREQFKLIGKSIPKLYTTSKTNGSAKFGIDVRIPNMKFATVKQSPVFGGDLVDYDTNAALAVKGVETVVPIPHGVAVVADSTWHAMQGLEALDTKFHGGKTVGLDSQTIYEKLNKATNRDFTSNEMEASNVVEAEYEMPYLHHAAMEPVNCTAHVTENFCEMWAPTQNQYACMEVAKKVTELPEEQIRINSIMMGGSFGRKLMDDYIEQALIVSKSIKKPVQVVWSREEDTRHGFYRPASVSKFRVEVDAEGIPTKWENHVSQENLAASDFFMGPMFGKLNFDPMTIPGRVHDYPIIPKHFYKVEGVDVSHSPVELGVPVGPWRAPPNSINVFYTESIMDELAYAAGVDPLEYRLKFLHENPRHKRILEQVANQSNWGSTLSKGHGRGIAINDWFPLEGVTTVAAQVAEVSINSRGRVNVHRVDCVVDCGLVVNPDSVIAQIEGSIIMGMSATLFEKITLKDGQIIQGNFDDYKIARMRDTPEINVTIVESNGSPSGSGEPASSPIVPAITNAIFAATGTRIRKLPLGKQKLV